MLHAVDGHRVQHISEFVEDARLIPDLRPTADAAMFVGLRGQKQRSDAGVKHVRYTADRDTISVEAFFRSGSQAGIPALPDLGPFMAHTDEIQRWLKGRLLEANRK